MDLYGTSDNLTNPPISQDGYGLGRLDRLARTSADSSASEYQFANGGVVPYIGGPGMDPAVANSYAVAPTNLAEVAKLGQDPAPATDVRSLTRNAITDPLGRTTGQATGMGGKGMGGNPIGMQTSGNNPGLAAMLSTFNPGLSRLLGRTVAPTPVMPTMQDYISAAQRTYMPEQSMATVNTPGAPEFSQFTNINPVAVKKAVGGGIHALRSGGSPSKGGYLDGAGDGMSDSIPATIEGKQPARLADGEFVIPADVVSHLGNGSTKAGAKQLYKMLDKIRSARTGTKKQGKQINPSKFMPA
jgi:hypothetical protein